MRPTTRELVTGCIVDALLQAGVEREGIRFDATWEQLGADRVLVVRAVERRYGVRTSTQELAPVCTVGQAVDFVVGRVAALSRHRALFRNGGRVRRTLR